MAFITFLSAVVYLLSHKAARSAARNSSFSRRSLVINRALYVYSTLPVERTLLAAALRALRAFSACICILNHSSINSPLRVLAYTPLANYIILRYRSSSRSGYNHNSAPASAIWRTVRGISANSWNCYAGGVAGRGGRSISRTLSSTIKGLYRISPVFFQANLIVIILNTYWRNPLKIFRNSTLVKVLSSANPNPAPPAPRLASSPRGPIRPGAGP